MVTQCLMREEAKPWLARGLGYAGGEGGGETGRGTISDEIQMTEPRSREASLRDSLIDGMGLMGVRSNRVVEVLFVRLIFRGMILFFGEYPSSSLGREVWEGKGGLKRGAVEFGFNRWDGFDGCWIKQSGGSVICPLNLSRDDFFFGEYPSSFDEKFLKVRVV
ncbi:hypothetical protein KM043_014872 [Ampulex compressa]|nr:hypothetical protein KM043_014872 [Ampulex compressa]